MFQKCGELHTGPHSSRLYSSCVPYLELIFKEVLLIDFQRLVNFAFRSAVSSIWARTQSDNPLLLYTWLVTHHSVEVLFHILVQNI